MSEKLQSPQELERKTRSQINTFARQWEEILSSARFPQVFELDGLRWHATITLEGKGDPQAVNSDVVVDMPEQEPEKAPRARGRQAQEVQAQTKLMD